eukprot:3450235-Amphidinium_carterae.1
MQRKQTNKRASKTDKNEREQKRKNKKTTGSFVTAHLSSASSLEWIGVLPMRKRQPSSGRAAW